MEINANKRKKVVAYIRKSSEDNKDGEAKKQLNSLDYQKRFCTEKIKEMGFELAHSFFIDDKTGYEAFCRESFQEMRDFLEEQKGEIDGIVCTEVSRLARNFGDGGMILWYLQNGTIHNIYTLGKTFTNSSSDQMMVAIELAMSKKSSDDTGQRTKQALRSKAFTSKQPPFPPVIGYKTEGRVGAKKWIVDSEIGPLMRQVFEAFATGRYTFEEIANYAFDFGLRSRDSKNSGGKASPNTWRNRLKNRIYIGMFEKDGEEIIGEFEPLISQDVFYRVQQVLQKSSHDKSPHINYAYSHLVRCDRCGDFLSGTTKKGITYYRCAKRRSPCCELEQVPYAREQDLEKTLVEALKTIEIDDKLWLKAQKYVAELTVPEKDSIVRQIRAINQQISSLKNRQLQFGKRLTDGDLEKEDYDRLMEDNKTHLSSLEVSLQHCQNISEELDRLMSEFLKSIKEICARFEYAYPENKRDLVNVFCENLRWDDEKLRWDWKKPYFILVNQPEDSTMLPG